MLRFCSLSSGRLRCLWFLMGLSHPLHTQSSPTRCAAAQDESPWPNAQGLCWTEALTLPEVTFNAEWIDSLPWPWLSDSICTKELQARSDCAVPADVGLWGEPVELQQLENGLWSWGKRSSGAQGIPAHPCSSHTMHIFTLLVLLGLGSCQEPYSQFEFVGWEDPASMNWLKWALMNLVSIKGVPSCCGSDKLNSNSASLH